MNLRSAWSRLRFALVLMLTCMVPALWWSTAHAAPSDVSADNRSDILFAETSGAVNVLLMNGTAVTAQGSLLPASSGWTVTQVTDLNADGKADVFLKNADGRVSVLVMNGTTVTSFTTLFAAGAGWNVTHVGDFDGNGKPDLLLRHTDGRVAVQLMNGTTVVSNTLMLAAGSPYSVALVADFNGDGKTDIVLKHTDGSAVILLMNGATASLAAPLLTAGSPWKVLLAGDFDGDKKADLVIGNSDGSAAILLMNGAVVAKAEFLLTAGSQFSVSHVGDFNGDGKADLLIQNTDKSTAILLMNGTVVSAATYLLNPGSNNKVIQIGDYDGDGKSDVLLRGEDGVIALALMNGGAVKSAALLWGASDRQVVPGDAFLNTVSAKADASHFLAQATFGPRMSEIDALSQSSFDAWLTTQFAKPQTLHLPPVTAYLLTLPEADRRGQTAFYWTMWKNFSTADDQLRQRIAYSLSQIFVISVQSDLAFGQPRGPANYLDVLGANAFGNYRTLLEQVTYSPMMGLYLSSLRNRKGDPATGRVPDENYAREVMQLFSIGLYELNQDGTLKLDGAGKPIETYDNDDVSGIAKVFTGLSWAGPDTTDARFNGGPTGGADPDREIKPMQAYNQFHAPEEKRFLTAVIPQRATPDTNADIRIALDTLFNHPNVGPFFGKQMIQRLVKSNPSPAYVSRVAAAFANNGSGVRGDMKAVIRAVLLDPEARSPVARTYTSGKLREPVVRFVQWMRAFNASSQDGQFLLGTLSDPATPFSTFIAQAMYRRIPE
jgi:Protein of unknown function (DUF1800)/FG-GAP-like repeat